MNAVPGAPDGDRQLCTFLVAGRTFGLELSMLREVLQAQPLTRVPLAPRHLRGLINLRGHIVTAVDLRERLGLPAAPADRLPMNVIVEGGDGLYSLLVDEVGDVVAVSARQVEALPDTVGDAARQLVSCVYKRQDELILLLDLDKTIGRSPPPPRND